MIAFSANGERDFRGTATPDRSGVLRNTGKMADSRRALLTIISSLLSNKQIRILQSIYAKGIESIAEIAQRTNCPPVLLYSVLTPLWNKTILKLRLIKVEKQVILLRNKGISDAEIAAQLKLDPEVVAEHSDGRFSPEAFANRPWYHDRAVKPKDPNDLEYEESTLPPTSRLGWKDDVLTDIPEHLKGRCPYCGHLVSLPCLACRLRKDMRIRKINKAPAYVPVDDEEDVPVEPELQFV